MITYKSLDQLVLQLIKSYATEKKSNSSMSSQYTSDLLPYSASKDVSSDETTEIVRALVDSLNKLIKPYIDKGLEVTASSPPDMFVNISSGAGVVSGHYVEVDENIKLKVPYDLVTSLFYVNFDGNQITVEPHKFDNKLALAKIVIPRPDVAHEIEDDQPDDKSNLNGWIVSGKDILFDGSWTFDDDSLAILGNKLNYILAKNIFGELNLSENLTIKNTQGTLKADSKSLSFYYENTGTGDVKAAEFNRRGTFYYNNSGNEVARFTSIDARVGNIVIETNSIHSGNYSAGSSGFKINDDGTSEFSDVTVRGKIYASVGELGGWIVDANKIYHVGTGSSGIIQGGTIRTAASVGEGASGVIFDTAGIRGYSDVLGQVFNLPTDGSAPTFASGIINNTVINMTESAVMRTSEHVGDGTSESYGVLVNNTGIYGCAANQFLADANFKLLAASGDAFFRGEISATSGTIGGFTIEGNQLTGGSIYGALIEGSTIQTDSEIQKIRIDNLGMHLLASGAGTIPYYGDGSKYGTETLSGAGIKYGTGRIAVINSPTYRVPFYIVSEQNVADFHFIDRDTNPSGKAEAGDVCVVDEQLKLCVQDGSPGVWKVVGPQTGSGFEMQLSSLSNNDILVYSGATLNKFVNKSHRHKRGFLWFVSSDLETTSKTAIIRSPFDGNYTRISADIDTPCSGANIIIDIHKNDVSIWSGNQANRLTLETYSGAAIQQVFDAPSTFVKDDIFKVYVDQIGSQTAGANLTIILETLATETGL